MDSVKDQDMVMNTDSSKELSPVQPAADGTVSAAKVIDGTGERAVAQATGETVDDKVSPKQASLSVAASQPVDADSARNAILCAQCDASPVGEDSKKKKKKSKRPKSAQASSSGSAAQTEDGVEVELTESLKAMSVSEGTVVESPADSKQKKKKKKKKKEKVDTSLAEGSVEGQKDISEKAESVGKEQEKQIPKEQEKQGTKEQVSEDAEKRVQGASNLQNLANNLFKKQKAQQKLHQQQPIFMTSQMLQQMMQQTGTPQMSMQHQGIIPAPGQPPQPLFPHHMQQQIRQHGKKQGQNQQQKMHQQAQYSGQDQQQGQSHGRGHQQKQQQNRKHQKKNIFEPYWQTEEVSAGLKRGTLVQGPIRINPRNYEDAYVPLPDGSADIYISGMSDRNRALNGDVVAVLIQDRDNWRVFTDQVDYYEKSNSPMKLDKTMEEENETADTSREKTAEADTAKDADSQQQCPDVLVEEEEEVELDSSGKPIEGSQVTKPITGSDATPSQATASSTPSTQSPSRQNSSGKGARPKHGSKDGDGKQCSSNKARRFKSVKEVMDQASPVVRKLFDRDGPGGSEGDKGEETINTDRFMQRTGKVVAIIEKKHSRAGSGNLRKLQDNNHAFATFAPTDSRVPRMMIPVSELPTGFKERPDDFAKILFIARITEWGESCKMPKGTLARSLGEAGQVEPETEALLTENSVDSSEFSEEVLDCLPKQSPWTIPAKELQWRRDLRQECVFTIDPATARDLDDALHCKDLGNGEYEVGVHIADVSYFVKEGTALDEVAKSRATSVYLVQKVIPMLPRLLCEQLCSLNPDEDRLSFSVIWKLTADGQILDEWFGRTVIRSCVKLSYSHAQGFIDEPDREWTTEELPPISQGFTVEDIKTRVLQMDRMAKAMRQARFDSGALRLDQVKIQFTLNKESGLPNGYFVYQQRDSNKLVEEFMLLANMAVAHKIRVAHKDKALLRRHPPPQSRMVNELKEQCASLGFPIEVESAKDIQLSLARYMGEDELSLARMQVLVALCSRPMRNAKYFCCGMVADESLYHHYALNVPLYTHFTSPIRRYPDVLVHRTLAAALDYCEVTDRSSSEVHQIAEHCNDKKTNAKQCSEKSNELYFAIFVKEAGPLEEKGMVMSVLDKSFDVYFLQLGVIKRVYCEKLPLQKFTHHKEGKRPELTLVWKPDDGCPHMVTQKISIFSCVNCVLQAEPEPLRWSAIIRRPLDGDVSIIQ